MPSLASRRAVLALAVALAAGLLGACGVSVKLHGDASTPVGAPTSTRSTDGSDNGSAPAPVDAATCKEQLGRTEAGALAGASLRGPKQTPVLALISCRWRDDAGRARVTTMEGSMTAWEDLVPASMLASFRSVVHLSGDACEMFKAMTGAAHGSTDPGPSHLIRYVPNPQHPNAVEGQQCRRGRFSSVMLKDDDLEPGSAVESRINAALAAIAD
jgi:hypothetical protein